MRFDAAPRRNDPTVMHIYSRIFVIRQMIFARLSSWPLSIKHDAIAVSVTLAHAIRTTNLDVSTRAL